MCGVVANSVDRLDGRLLCLGPGISRPLRSAYARLPDPRHPHAWHEWSRIAKRFSAVADLPPIIFITAHGEIPLATQALRAGAVDFIQKPFSPQTLLDRVSEALELDRNNRCKDVRSGDIQDRLTHLTDREREIADLLARGESTKQIAIRLSISPKTVDNHRTKIFGKMNVDNSTQLANLVAML